MTNKDLILKVMNHSKYGALSQAFVMQALEAQCDAVIKNKEELIKEQEENIKNGKMPFINIHSWIGVAEETKKIFEERR